MTESKKNNRTVLVTGFGPFGGHPINASWEAVKALKDLGLEKTLGVTLICEEISVTYECVSSVVPKLWREHEPTLVVHVGVSHMAKCLELESQAHGIGYVQLDVENKCPLEKLEEIEKVRLETEIDVRRICQKMNSCCNSSGGKEERCEAMVSEDAGRYLCEYIYHRSLSIHRGKTLFVHVPDLGIYPAKKTAEGLYSVIQFALEMMEKENEKKK